MRMKQAKDEAMVEIEKYKAERGGLQGERGEAVGEQGGKPSQD